MDVPTLADVRARDGDRCARCGRGDRLHVHHRRRRSQGGDSGWSNLITLCLDCHHWVHHNIARAQFEGWLLRAGRDASKSTIMHHMWPGGPVHLLDDGSIEMCIDA